MTLRKKLLVLPPLALGILVLALMVRGRSGPEPAALAEHATPVEVVLVERSSIVPRAIGYGTVEPRRTWVSIAEVSARVLAVHPRLRPGEVMPAEVELVRMDPTDFQLRVARLEAELASTEAERERLDVVRDNTRQSIEVARSSLALAERELERLNTLVESGNVSQSAVDAQEQAVLRERSSLVNLESTVRTADADEKVLIARASSTTAQISETRRDIARTVISTPFPVRIAEVDVEEAQFVAAGATMLSADGIRTAEVVAQLAIERVRHLVRPDQRAAASAAFDMDGEFWERLGLTAEVRLVGSDFTTVWPARFDRASGGLDPRTRTVGFVAAVDGAYESGTTGRPPLVKGMFVEVEFQAPPLEDRVVVPFTAIHGERAFVVDADGRLEIREVELEFVQFDEACVASGLEPGDRLVLTDVVPAIPGMLLAPQTAPAATDAR
jgi:multidrug efflux pump subunit AcrA (membrane-fusion protein)